MVTTRGYSDELDALTPRMLAVLRSAACGASAGETAGELHVAEATVRGIRSAALARLGARNVVEAVAIAYGRRLL